MSELISVIIPVYNVEPFLRRCVDSIIGQTYSSLEIILVNDGSPDNCGDICDEYAQKDSRVRVIHKENGGLSDARNAGIEKANGEFITFVDSDDWIDHKFIEKLYELAKGSNSEIVVCDFFRTSNEEINPENYLIELHGFSNIEALEQLYGKFYVQLVIACAKLFDSRLFEKIRFPKGRLHEDEFVTYKLLHKAKKITLTTEQLYYYWQREDSIMGRATLNLKNVLDSIDALEERIAYFEGIHQIALRDKTIKRCFLFYKKINDDLKLFANHEDQRLFEQRLRRFRSVLKTSTQPFRFKLYYELYFTLPWFSKIAFSVYIKFTQFLNKKTL